MIDGEGFAGDSILELRTRIAVFGESGNLTVGKAPARTLRARVRWNGELPPDGAEIRPYIRITDGTRYSEWLPKGVFYIDQKELNYDRTCLTILAYDVMMKAETAYTTELTFPAADIQIVREISEILGADIDARTYRLMTKGFTLERRDGWTVREALGDAAGLYAGSFITSDEGKLRLVSLFDAPSARVLGTETENTALSVGGTLIGV